MKVLPQYLVLLERNVFSSCTWCHWNSCALTQCSPFSLWEKSPPPDRSTLCSVALGGKGSTINFILSSQLCPNSYIFKFSSGVLQFPFGKAGFPFLSSVFFFCPGQHFFLNSGERDWGGFATLFHSTELFCLLPDAQEGKTLPKFLGVWCWIPQLSH